MTNPIPIIDLFAGTGGLGEGFSSLTDSSGERVFDVRVSIEKETNVYRTLFLRTIFRSFPMGRVPDCYYDYIQGNITRDELLSNSEVSEEVRVASNTAKHANLGETPDTDIDQWIHEAIGNREPWVLIGGPPCQVYSTVGRSRMQNIDPEAFRKDKRQFLYKEYLRIVRKFGPSIFVMENVKGILSSIHNGAFIFDEIMKNFSRPGNGLEYDIRSFVVKNRGASINPYDFIVEAEKFGLPQRRHRVILFGIRKDMMKFDHKILSPSQSGKVSVSQVLSDLPPLRSRLSKEPDSFESWISAIKDVRDIVKGWQIEGSERMDDVMRRALTQAMGHKSIGDRFMSGDMKINPLMPKSLRDWYYDPKLAGIILHETRSHMRSDLHRYLFASCYAVVFGISPKRKECSRQMELL